jgi:hypothetical protein
VEAALLTVEDLGNGWVDTGPTPFEVRGLDECPATNVLTAGKDPGRVGEAPTSFTRGDGAPAPAPLIAGPPAGRPDSRDRSHAGDRHRRT